METLDLQKILSFAKDRALTGSVDEAKFYLDSLGNYIPRGKKE